MLDLVLVEKLKNGDVIQVLLTEVQELEVKSGAIYSLFDQATMLPPAGLTLKRKGTALEVEVEQELVARIEGFYDDGSKAVFSVDGSASEAMVVSEATAPDAAAGERGDGIVWQASAETPQTTGLSLGAGALGVGLVAITAAAAASNGGSGDATAPPPPSISAVSIPDATMNVGDVVTITLTVADDGGDTYTNVSGTVGGFDLSNLARTNSTTYTAQFTVTEGGTDVAAGADIPVSMTIDDAAGNTSTAFTTPISQAGDAIDANSPVISAASIPNAAMNVGDVVTITLTVADDGGDTYTNVSGTVGGFDLSNLARTNSTTYTAQFTVTEGGTDVAAGADIPVSMTIDDAAGNTSTAFTTPISQAGDAIDANSPVISAASIPNTTMNVGDVVPVTLTVADDGGVAYTNLSGTVGGFTLSNLTRTNSTSYTAQFTVTEGGTDVAAGADIPVSMTIDDAAGNTSTAFTTPISQAGDAIDANSPVISAASIPNTTMNVGDVVPVTLTVADDGGVAYTNLSGTVGGFDLSNLARTNSTSYTAQFTVTEGGTDVAAGADIPVSMTIDDAAGNTSTAFTTPISQAGDSIDANSPVISAASIPNTTMNVGDVVPVTLTVADDGGVAYTNLSGTVGGFTLSNLTRTNSTSYTAQFTVTEGGTDVAAGADIPVSMTIDDAAGNTSTAFTTPISQAGDAIDANSPVISAASIPNTTMNVGDVVPVTLTVADDGGVAYTNLSGTVDGFTLSNLTRTNSTSYTAQFTVTEGGTDVAAGADIPVSMTIDDSAGNTSATFNTPISQAGDAIDANSPVISAASIPNAAMNVGDVVTVTLNVADDGGDTYNNISGTVGGFALSNLTRTNSTSYTAQFTVTEGGTDVAAGADIPVSMTIDDAAGNTSTAFTTPISQVGDAIDANSPVISAASIPNAAMNVGDVVTVTLNVADDGGDTYNNISGTVGGFALSNLTRTNSTSYTAQFTVTEGGTDVAAGADIPVSMTIDDSAGNTSATFNTPISQAGDAIDANSPVISAASIPNAAMNVGDVVTVTLNVADDGGDTYNNISGTVGGFALSNLTRTNSTTYTAQFTVTEGGTDVAAGSDIPVSITIDDAAGNTSTAFTTPINQAADAIDANSPVISAASIPNAAMNVGDVVTVTLNVADDGGDTYNNISGTVGGFALSNLTRTNSTTYTAQFTVTEGGTDVAAGADIPVSMTIDDSAGNTSATFNTPISQASDAIDANSPSISAVSIPDAAMNVGDVVSVTLTVADDGGDTYTNLSGTVGGFALSNLTRTNSTTYSAQFTVTEGGSDVAAGADIPVSMTIDDSAGNTSATFNTPISQASDAIDANSPVISAASIPNAAMNVGDVVTVTLNVADDGGDTYNNISGTVGGFALSNLTRTNSTTYTAQFTVTEGGTDVVAGSDIPVSMTIDDSAGNTSATFNTPISQASDAIDANSPSISAVSIPDAAMNVGDVVSVTLTVADDGGDTYTNLSGTVGGFALSNLTRTNSTTYSAQFTVTEGGSDVAAGADIPVSMTIDDSAGNTSATFNTAISQASDAIDANSPSISAVSIPDAAMNVGDVVSVTLTVADDGGDTYTNLSGTVGGFALSNLTRTNSTTYSAQFTVTEGGSDVAAGADIPVSMTIDDTAGNTSATFNTAISQVSDAIDANSPTLSSSTPVDNASGVALDANIVLNFNEFIALGTGNIVISDGTDTITIDVASHFGQLSVSGGQLTINPTADLANNSANYNVQLASTAIVDTAGNAYAGIADTTTLDFTTVVDTSVVVFDLTAGTSSDHSSRTFSGGVAYDIYIVVPSNSEAISMSSAWSGASNLGSDDTIHLVGSGSPILGTGGGIITSVSVTFGSISYLTPGAAAYMAVSGFFSRFTSGAGVNVDIYATGSHTSNIIAAPAINTLPTSIAATQSLS